MKTKAIPVVGLLLGVEAVTGQVYHTTPDWISADTEVSTGAALVDLDLDGWLDIVVSNGNDMQQQRVAVYYNLGDGTFPSVPDWQSSDIAYNGQLDVADVNGDGWPDVAVAALLNLGGPAAKLYLNNGGTLSSLPDWACTETERAFGVAFGDVNNDGRPDLAVATGWPYSAGYEAHSTVHLNLDGRLEADPGWQSDDLHDYMGAVWVDADNDGWLDLVGVSAHTDTWLYHNLGGVLETQATWHTTDNSDQYVLMGTAGDIDDDGFLDLFVSGNTQLGGGGFFRQYAGLDDGFFTQTPVWDYYEGGGSAVALADVDADGDLDLATGGWWDSARLFLNDEGQLPLTPDWSSTQTSVIEKIVFGDVDKDGLRRTIKTFTPDGDRRLFYLEHQPIQYVRDVRRDGLPLMPHQYVLDPDHGWISVSIAPTETLEVDYVYSLKLDMAISNWDNDDGNYLYYNQLSVDGDCNADEVIDLADFACVCDCMTGPKDDDSLDPACERFDLDLDRDVDLHDFVEFTLAFTGG